MIRSKRRQSMTAVLLLLCYGMGLPFGAAAAIKAPSNRPGAKQYIAQGSMLSNKLIPSEVQGWFDAMKELADKGNGAEALKMHQRVTNWVRENLPEKDVFRARVMVRRGYVLDTMGELQEALASTRKGAQMLREISESNRDPELRYYLSVALYNLGKRHERLGQKKPAIDSFQEALSLLGELAKTSKDAGELLGETLWQLGLIYSSLGQAKNLRDSFSANLPMLRALRKSDTISPDGFGLLLVTLAASNLDHGSWADALSISQEATSLLREQSVSRPPRQLILSAALGIEGLTHNILGNYRQGLVSGKEAVLLLKGFTEDSPEANPIRALALVSLSENYRKTGQLAQAIVASEGAIAILAKNPNGQVNTFTNLLLVTALSSLGLSHLSLSNWEKAIEPSQRAAGMLREAVNTFPENKEVLKLFAQVQLAVGIAQAMIAPGDAMLGSMQETVRILRTLPKDDLTGQSLLGLTLFVLGAQHSVLGRRQEGLRATQEGLKIQRVFPDTDPTLQYLSVAGLQIHGFQLTAMGRYQDALVPSIEAVRLSRRLVASSSEYNQLLASSLLQTAKVYYYLGDSAESLALAEEALRISRRLKAGPKPLSTEVDSLVLIGGIQAEQGQLLRSFGNTQKAIDLLRVSSRNNVFDRSMLALALKNLAQLQLREGENLKALSSAREAVEIDRSLAEAKVDSLDQLADSATTLAVVFIRQGRYATAGELLREAVGNEVRFLQQQLPLMPEGRRQALVDTLGRRWEIPYSLAQQGEAGASLALYTRLNRHSPLQEIERRQSLISRSSAATQALVNRLSILNGQISNPTLTVQARQNALAESERLQEDLHRQLPALQPRLVEIAEVARQLPADGVLVEFQRYSPYNSAKQGRDAWAKPRYLALVLDRRGSPLAVDLGDAEALEQAIASALDRTRFQQPGAESAWALVAEKLFSPLSGALEGKRRLLASPDGQLHRVPFSALALLKGKSAVLPTSLTLQTIGSGRDLVPLPGQTLASATMTASAPLVLADPQTIGWDPLVRAASEGQSVASTLGTQPHLGKTATVALLEQTRGPRIVHVAGHGYFDPQASGDLLLASGLALAGANKATLPSRPLLPPATGSAMTADASPADDGYLTAKEAARLQLDGTTLVVLSACESGLGRERTGEGLFGLQRALTVAGARGTLLSLWKVPEHASETFMTRFYAQIRQGIPPAEAVRRVQAEFRAHPRLDGWSDPFYWAGWQYSGLPDPVR